MGSGNDADEFGQPTRRYSEFAIRDDGQRSGLEGNSPTGNVQPTGEFSYGQFAHHSEDNPINSSHDWGGAQDPASARPQIRGRRATYGAIAPRTKDTAGGSTPQAADTASQPPDSGNNARGGRATYGNVAPGAIDASNQPYNPLAYDRRGPAAKHEPVPGAVPATKNGRLAGHGDAPQQPAAQPGAVALERQKTTAAAVEQSLDKQAENFIGNNISAGIGGVIGGGVLSRVLSYGAKWYLVHSDNSGRSADVSGRSDLPGGLDQEAGRTAYARLAEEQMRADGALRDSLKEIEAQTRDAVKKPAVELTIDEKILLEKRQYLADVLKNPSRYSEGNQNKMAIPEQLFSEAELKTIRHYLQVREQIGGFKTIQAENAAALEKSLSRGQRAALWFERNHGLGPSMDFLAGLRSRESSLTAQIGKAAEKLEPDYERLQHEMRVRALTTPEQEALLRRYNILTGPTIVLDVDKDGLSAQEADLLKKLGGLNGEIQRIEEQGREIPGQPKPATAADLIALTSRLPKLESSLNQVIRDLDRQLKPLADKPPEAWSDAEKALSAKQSYLKAFMQDHSQAPGNFVKLDAREVGLVAERQELKAKVAALEPIIQERVVKLPGLKVQAEDLRGQIRAIADAMKPEAEKLEARLKTAPSLLTETEKAVIARFNFLKSGATGEIPAGLVLPPEEASLVATRNSLTARLKLGAERLALAGESDLKLPAFWSPEGLIGHARNFGKGVLVMAGVQAAESAIDRLIWDKNHAIKTSWYADSIILPASMLLTKSPVSWALMAGAGHLLGGYLDRHYPVDPNSSFGKFLRPNGVESALVGVAALLPMREETLAKRAAYVGIAWLGSKLLNLCTEKDTPRDIRDQAFDLFKADKTERSAHSMTRAIEKFSDLGRAKEPALNWYLHDWLSKKHEDSINGYRGAAILLTSAGEIRLGRGTLVSPGMGQATSNPVYRELAAKNGPDDSNNILAGYDLDLGGQALRRLAPARDEINLAKKYTQEMLAKDPNATLRGTAVKQSEVDDLEKLGQRVDIDLARIYGKHDVLSACKEIEEYASKRGFGSLNPNVNNPKELAKILDGAKQAFARTRADANPRYRAKLCRDVALIDLAWAGTKVGYNGIGGGGDGSKAAALYSEAVAYIAQAKQLDPGNLDNPQLDLIVSDLSKLIYRQADQQFSSPAHNGLNVNNGLYKM